MSDPSPIERACMFCNRTVVLAYEAEVKYMRGRCVCGAFCTSDPDTHEPHDGRTEPPRCDFRNDHDPVNDLPIGEKCGATATHRLEWEDGRYSFGCSAHLEIDAAATVKLIRIVALAGPPIVVTPHGGAS